MKVLSLVISVFFGILSTVSAETSTTPKLLWDSWYTVTAAGKTPYGYYNDKFEKKGDRIAFKNQFWKNDEGYINEEQVVAIASDNENLSPEFWNFHSSYRSTTLDIDGTVKGIQLSAKVRTNKETLPSVSHSLSPKTFMSVMFPVWLGKKIPSMKLGAATSFSVVFEDSLDSKFSALSGSARLSKPDEYSKKSGTTRVEVDIDNKKSVWYVLPTGEPTRIEMTSQNLIVSKESEAVARRYLMKLETQSVPVAVPPPSPKSK